MADVLPVRRRMAAVGLVTAVVAASGFGLSRGVGPRALGVGGALGARSGAMFCPHGGSAGWRAWVVVANPGSHAVRIRVTPLGASGPGPQSTFTVLPLHQVYREVPAGEPSSATEVEYFGGWVGAAAVVLPAGGSAMASERCAAASRSAWFIPDQTTGPGQSTYTVVMNPFGQPAEFDLVIRTEKRVVQPGPLTPYVLPGHTAIGLPLNKYLLQTPDEHTVSAEVVTRAGRVAAGGVVISPHAVREEAGITGTHPRWFAPVGGYGGAAEVVLMNPGLARADLSILALGSRSQQVASGPNGVSVPSNAVATSSVDLSGAPGIVLRSMNGQSMVAAVRVQGPSGDSDTVNPATAPSRRWLVLPSVTPVGGLTYVILQNVGESIAQVSFTLLGPDGPVVPALPGVSVPPGRTISVRVRSGGGAVTVLAEAASGTIVAGSASSSSDGSGFAATLGLPVGAG